MKPLLAIMLFIFSLNCVHAQKIKKSEVNQNALAKFNAMYPVNEKLSWYKKDSITEASFRANSNNLVYSGFVETIVRFNEKGNLIETEEVLKDFNIPKEIVASFELNYPKLKIKEARQITSSTKKKSYKILTNESNIFFDASGKIMNEVKEE